MALTHVIVSVWIHLFLFLSSAHTECKLSRPGPPATIVTIDEESPNGMYQPVLCLLRSLNITLAQLFLHCVVLWSALLGLFMHHSECFCNAKHINASAAAIVHLPWLNKVPLFCRVQCYMFCHALWFDNFWLDCNWKIDKYLLFVICRFVCLSLTKQIQMLPGVQWWHRLH